MAAFLKVLRVTSEVDDLRPGQIATNIGLTIDGLRLAGLSEKEVNSLPDEFVQGMQQRAGLLGDVRWSTIPGAGACRRSTGTSVRTRPTSAKTIRNRASTWRPCML